jgi:hypothetical protein
VRMPCTTRGRNERPSSSVPRRNSHDGGERRGPTAISSDPRSAGSGRRSDEHDDDEKDEGAAGKRVEAGRAAAARANAYRTRGGRRQGLGAHTHQPARLPIRGSSTA